MTKGHGDDGYHAAEGIASEADDPAADIAAAGGGRLTEGLEALVDPALGRLRNIQRVPVPDAWRALAWASSHSSARLPRIWAACRPPAAPAGAAGTPRATTSRGRRLPRRWGDESL